MIHIISKKKRGRRLIRLKLKMRILTTHLADLKIAIVNGYKRDNSAQNIHRWMIAVHHNIELHMKNDAAEIYYRNKRKTEPLRSN